MILAPGTKRINSTRRDIWTKPLEKLNYSPYLFTADNFFRPEECGSWIRYSTSEGFADINSSGNHMYAARNQGRLQIELAETAAAIFHRLLPIIPTEIDGFHAVGCSSNIRLYRYLPGQLFGKHIDESNVDPQGRGATQLTVLIYLNGGGGGDDLSSESILTSVETISGGETIFYKNGSVANGKKTEKREKKTLDSSVFASVKPEAGKVLVHAHGHRCMTHEGAAVLQGVKYVLRTDVVYG